LQGATKTHTDKHTDQAQDIHSNSQHQALLTVLANWAKMQNIAKLSCKTPYNDEIFSTTLKNNSCKQESSLLKKPESGHLFLILSIYCITNRHMNATLINFFSGLTCNTLQLTCSWKLTCSSTDLVLDAVMSCATVRRHCDCFIASLAPFINIQTYPFHCPSDSVKAMTGSQSANPAPVNITQCILIPSLSTDSTSKAFSRYLAVLHFCDTSTLYSMQTSKNLRDVMKLVKISIDWMQIST